MSRTYSALTLSLAATLGLPARVLSAPPAEQREGRAAHALGTPVGSGDRRRDPSRAHSRLDRLPLGVHRHRRAPKPGAARNCAANGATQRGRAHRQRRTGGYRHTGDLQDKVR